MKSGFTLLIPLNANMTLTRASGAAASFSKGSLVAIYETGTFQAWTHMPSNSRTLQILPQWRLALVIQEIGPLLRLVFHPRPVSALLLAGNHARDVTKSLLQATTRPHGRSAHASMYVHTARPKRPYGFGIVCSH